MGRAVVKGISTPVGGTTGISTTVSATGATGSTTQGITTPPGQVLMGTLQDAQTNTIVSFAQAFGAELGLQVGSKVDYQTVNVSGQVIANVVKLVHRGEVASINPTNDGGTLLDKASNVQIPFAQQYVAESGLLVGSKVNYERIIDPVSGNITGVALVTVTA